MATPARYQKLRRNPGTRVKVPLKYLTAKQREQRLNRLRSNPSSRASLPTKYLTPQQQMQRRVAQRNKRLADITTVKTGPDLRSLAEQFANTEINPQIGALDRQQSELQRLLGEKTGSLSRLGTQATGNIEDYYRALAQSEAQSLEQQKAITAASTGNVAQIGQQTQGELSGLQAAIGKRLGTEAQLSGGQQAIDPALAAQQAAQSGRASREAQAMQGMAQMTGGNFQGLQAAMASANQARGAEHKTNVQNTLAQQIAELTSEFGSDIREVTGQKADIQATKGGLINKYLTSLTENERDFLLGQGALNTDAAKIQAGLQEAERDRQFKKNTRRTDIGLKKQAMENQETDRKHKRTIAEQREQRLASKQGETVKQRRDRIAKNKRAKRFRQEASQSAQALIKGGGVPNTKAKWESFRNNLLKAGHDKEAVAVIMSRLRKKYGKKGKPYGDSPDKILAGS